MLIERRYLVADSFTCCRNHKCGESSYAVVNVNFTGRCRQIQCHFGVSLSTMCDHLQQHFQIDDLDDTMTGSVLTDALDPADRYGLCDSTE